VFSLRSDIIPKHIRLDTTSIVHLLLSKKYGNKGDFLFKGNLKRREDDIWNFFFRTERCAFNKNGYGFHHMIETDGMSCTILYLREDKIGKKRLKPQKQSSELYISELTDYKSLQKKRIVGIDPGKCDLIYCIDGNTKTSTKFRYSMDQRRKETKSKKYAKIILEYKKTKIQGKTVIEHETELSKYNRKTLSVKSFITYITEKNKLNGILSEVYHKEIFRKLKLNGYINRKKSEQKLLNRFEKQFGNIKDTIIAFGDYEQKRHMKYKEPIKGKGIRILFRKHGYNTYLVDEFRTSCRCSNCGNECKKFMVRENPKPYKSNLRLVHGLLRCKNECSVWNRDCNGAINIYKIAYNSINKKARPNYLCRS
jgi:transposase